MNTKNLLIAALVGGVLTELLTNVPIINLLGCLFCASFWIGPLLAVWLYRRMQGELTLGQGIGIGALAGVIAGVIGFLLSFAHLSGMASFVNGMRPFLSAQDLQGVETAMSGPMLIGFNLIGVGVTILFGAIGGLIGGAIFKKRTPPAAAGEETKTDSG
jgi:hypothetical protein